ncbi:tRNA 4-thiouridine(8) synthase ThiI [Syntrophomonas palmitatica]|uniref:tRNA 4-thiouridine(8) synthase ThiI n=1 Tax=Syntrophomonas palmitatica TaxID=402877 RepID=UPI00241DBDB2|nr:tRNA 4-thiouridine(8) synthase ThiI [Syntrophomonas palmitatica]
MISDEEFLKQLKERDKNEGDKLFSGGLDSQLAVCVIKEQNIDVIAINFVTPFFGASDRTRKAAQALGVEFYNIDISEEYIPGVLKNPVYGYGKNMNPCIDCHGFMLKKAGDMMPTFGASFLITGEVLGQRPMSQNKSSMNAVEKISGYRGYIVRPLSGKLLPATEPELQGWIDREMLLDLSGRGRGRQMELAEQYGITDYPSPAGGCLLTDANYSGRLRQYLQVCGKPGRQELEILKYGRHFYRDNLLLVIGRNHSENERIQENTLDSDTLLKVADRPGPLGLIRPFGAMNTSNLEWAASLVARYSDAKTMNIARVKVFSPVCDDEQILNVVPAKD